MSIEEIALEAEDRMEKSVALLLDQLRGVRTGRANTGLVDSIRVDYYGSSTPLKQMANLSTPEPQQILIRPFDPGVLKEIEKTIQSSGLGMTPMNDGKMIRLTVPPMSGEQRKKMAGQLKKYGEEAKVACRNIRRDANKHFDQAEKDKEMSEDDRDKGKEEVQKLLKTYEDKVEEMVQKKTTEVMEG